MNYCAIDFTFAFLGVQRLMARWGRGAMRVEGATAGQRLGVAHLGGGCQEGQQVRATPQLFLHDCVQVFLLKLGIL